MDKVRIHKLLAESGVASRRAVEQMILDGKITVNGSLVTTLPCFVDPAADDIRVDGQPVRKRPARKLYFLLNKPKGVVCTQRDPQGRPCAANLIPHKGERIYCVGRLEVDSTGLVLLTNDGELTQYLTHPRYGVRRTYLVEIDGQLDSGQIGVLKRGVFMDGRKTQGAEVKVLSKTPGRSVYQVALREGPNRELRRVLAGFGLKVRKLKRVAIGPITGRGLKVGRWRVLGPDEVSMLRKCGSDMKSARGRPPVRAPFRAERAGERND